MHKNKNRFLWIAIAALLILVTFVAIACVGSIRGQRPVVLASVSLPAKKGLVGMYGSSVQTYPVLDKLLPSSPYTNIQNASWMLRTEDGTVITTNEYNSTLFWIDGANAYEYSLQDAKLSSPVHLLQYNNYIYVSCYGTVSPSTTGGYLRFPVSSRPDNQGNMTEIESYPISCIPNSRIHFINTLILKDSTTLLIAVDLGLDKLWNISSFSEPQDISGNIFGQFHPRHFVQVPGTDMIVLLTESNYPSTEPILPKLFLLEWSSDDKQFQIKHELELGCNGWIDTTGDEIQWDSNTNALYVTLRQYDSPFVPWTSNDNPGTPSTGGLFLRIELNNNKLTVTKQVQEGSPNPRYFTILDEVAYLCSQGVGDSKGSIIRVQLSDMKILDTVEYTQGQPAFYLPDV